MSGVNAAHEPGLDERQRIGPGRRHPAKPEPARIEQPVHRGERGQERPEGEDQHELARAQA